MAWSTGFAEITETWCADALEMTSVTRMPDLLSAMHKMQ